MNFTRLHEFAINHKVDYEELVRLFYTELSESSEAMQLASFQMDNAIQVIQRQSESLQALDERVIAFNTAPWYKRLWRSLWPI
jgi:hypothetical protein